MSYPRTPHLPFSPTIFSDDIKIQNINALKKFENNNIVILEKIDGLTVVYILSQKSVRQNHSTEEASCFSQ